MKKRTVHIPDEFRGFKLSIWQKILLRLGKPIFVTVEPGVICIVFIEDDRFKYKCSYPSVNEARKVWKKRAALALVSPDEDDGDSDGDGKGDSDDDDHGKGGGDGDGKGGGDGDGKGGSGGGGKGGSGGGGVPGGGGPRPTLTPSPNPRPKPKPPEEEKKKKKKEEPEPAPEPLVQPEEPGDDPFIDEPDEIVPLPTKTPEPVPDLPVTRPSRRPR